jgi:hypothetical protein
MKPHSFRQDLPVKLKADFQQDYQHFYAICLPYYQVVAKSMNNGQSICLLKNIIELNRNIDYYMN